MERSWISFFFFFLPFYFWGEGIIDDFLNAKKILTTFSQVMCEALCIRENSIITESRTTVLLAEFWCTALSFTRQPCNRAPIPETGSSFWKEVGTGKSIDNFTVVFGMKRISGYKLKC